MGYESMVRLKKLIPSICDLCLNNISFIGQRVNGVDFTKQDIV